VCDIRGYTCVYFLLFNCLKIFHSMNPLLSRLNVDSRWFFAILYASVPFQRDYIHFCEGRDAVGG
jgi:hypothetical protein